MLSRITEKYCRDIVVSIYFAEALSLLISWIVAVKVSLLNTQLDTYLYQCEMVLPVSTLLLRRKGERETEGMTYYLIHHDISHLEAFPLHPDLTCKTNLNPNPDPSPNS